MSTRRHGEASTYRRKATPEHAAWVSMRQRCRDPKCDNYKHYGGRGITICDHWNVYENFLADMGRRPSDQHSLDREDNNGNYEPGNCRWATVVTQNRNQRGRVAIMIDGVSKLACDWADEHGVDRHLFYNRLARGWTPHEALTIPVGGVIGKPYGPRGTHARAGRQHEATA